MHVQAFGASRLIAHAILLQNELSSFTNKAVLSLHDILQRIGEFRQRCQRFGHLPGCGCSLSRTARIGSGSIPRNDFDTG